MERNPEICRVSLIGDVRNIPAAMEIEIDGKILILAPEWDAFFRQPRPTSQKEYSNLLRKFEKDSVSVFQNLNFESDTTHQHLNPTQLSGDTQLEPETSKGGAPNPIRGLFENFNQKKQHQLASPQPSVVPELESLEEGEIRNIAESSASAE